MEPAGRTPRSFDAGRLLAALGAVVLFVGLFLDWYSPDELGGVEGASAWTVFEITDLLLALLAVLVLTAVIGALAPRAPVPPFSATAFTGAAIAGLVLVTTSLVNDPPAAQRASLEEGIWISFAGALLMVLGALLRNSRIAFVVTPREEPPRAERAEAETETETLRRP